MKWLKWSFAASSGSRGRTGLRRRHHKTLTAAKDEARPAALSRQPPEAQKLLLGERHGLVPAHVVEVHEPSRLHPFDGHNEVEVASRKLTEGAEDEARGRARVGLMGLSLLPELGLDKPQLAPRRSVYLAV